MSIKTNEIVQNETTRNTKAPFDREKFLAAEESIKLTKCKQPLQKMALTPAWGVGLFGKITIFMVQK